MKRFAETNGGACATGKVSARAYLEVCRHNVLIGGVDNCFAYLCSMACLSPQLEKGSGFNRPTDVLVPRPADVLVPRPADVLVPS